MFRRLIKNKKAQNTAEYAILISLVVACCTVACYTCMFFGCVRGGSTCHSGAGWPRREPVPDSVSALVCIEGDA